jgi:hypothetical protein
VAYRADDIPMNTEYYLADGVTGWLLVDHEGKMWKSGQIEAIRAASAMVQDGEADSVRVKSCANDSIFATLSKDDLGYVVLIPGLLKSL